MRGALLLSLAALGWAARAPAEDTAPVIPPIAAGPFQPSWASLEKYQCPEWFRDAKFGIWAHWGAQCEPEMGDWYAQRMYLQGSPDYAYQVAHFGHPSQAGFKEVIHAWKAEHFDPERLLAFYKQNGARYFVALATHCDNFDNYNSKYQPWNSVALGPHRDLIRDWAAAARRNGLRFGVSVHDGGWTWQWYGAARGADATGPRRGVPYDGRLTAADGHGKWWDGLDPQDLYAQNHPLGAPPDPAYCRKYFLRTQQLMDDYAPDLVYFDEGPLPMSYPECRASPLYGLNLYAHFYNATTARHGRNDAVITAKLLDPAQRQALVYDIERGKAPGILPQPWQTDTCLGDWHYSRALFAAHAYKPAATVIPMLADIVSRNGNLLLSVPVRADGTIDDDEARIVGEIGAWLRVNGEAIYGTRPWAVFGERPAAGAVQAKGTFDGVADWVAGALTAADLRFTQSKDGRYLYALALGWPADGRLVVKSLAPFPGSIHQVVLLGSPAPLAWEQTAAGLEVTLPARRPCDHVFVLRISGSGLGSPAAAGAPGAP